MPKLLFSLFVSVHHKVRKLFEAYGYKVNPAGVDVLQHNAEECYHLTVENGIRVVLIGAGLPIAEFCTKSSMKLL